VDEMLESAPTAGVGGSSAMPHKRNPVSCLQALTAATRTPGLAATLLAAALGEHERALGGWQAEIVTIPALLEAAGGALDALERIARGLVVKPERMAANLDALQGLVFSERLGRTLESHVDRATALALVEAWGETAATERRPLREVALAARPDLAQPVDAAFARETLLADLAPALDEQLAALEPDPSTTRHPGGPA
jgi:3-carboxy-cis,cis-muconate cycloisomerase